MIHDIPKPKISPDFMIEDIHAIREWHYEMLKDATPEERNAFYNEGAVEARRAIEEIRRQKSKAVV